MINKHNYKYILKSKVFTINITKKQIVGKKKKKKKMYEKLLLIFKQNYLRVFSAERVTLKLIIKLLNY